jgi:hypothetical protein
MVAFGFHPFMDSESPSGHLAGVTDYNIIDDSHLARWHRYIEK